MTFEIVNPPALGAPRGYNHGLLARGSGRWLFVAGQTAADVSGSVPSDDVAEQWGRALDKVLAVVRAAGGEPEHIARMTIYVTDLSAYASSRDRLSATYRERMGRHYPAMAVVEVAGLVDRGAVVEIEATALVP